EPRAGRALTSICKNDFAQTVPYNGALWVVFGPRQGKRRVEAQFFVRLDDTGLRAGVRLARRARDLVQRFKAAVADHAEEVFRLLRDRGALAECRFGPADAPDREIRTPAELREWAGSLKSFEASRAITADAPLVLGDDLVGEVLLTFDRLVPLFACM